MSTSAPEQPAPKQNARRTVGTVAYGSEAFEQAVAAIPDALREGSGMSFLFLGASQEQKEEALSAIGEYDDLNVHQFKVPQLIGERMMETQGNLRESFDNAGEDAAVLFFDEADVLLDASYAEDADEEDTALSSYFFERLSAYLGVAIACFSSPQSLPPMDDHEADVVVEF